MEINEVIPFLKEHAHVGWYGEKTPESSFESLEALPPDVLTQVCYLANGVYQPILDLESWLDTPWVIEGIEIYCANKGPNVYVPVTRERLNEVRNGLTNIRHHYGLDLCVILGQNPGGSGVRAINHLLGRQLSEVHEILEFLLDIGFRPSWREWVLAQYQAPAAYNAPSELVTDIPPHWLSYEGKAMTAQTNADIWALLAEICRWSWGPPLTLDLTPAALASARKAQGGLTDEDAINQLDELRRQHSIDICGDLEIYRSGLLVVETTAGDVTEEALHAMLDFLLDLGYWPTWREWVVAQLTNGLPEEIAGLSAEEYVADSVLGWEIHLPTKITAAQTNETIWETLWGLCGLAPTATQG